MYLLIGGNNIANLTLTWQRYMLCQAENVLQTKVDAQCDKFATELS